ncbi:MAG: hypothetical protein M3Y56_06990, partial [Armatimonadota bacterium]|nr:hypothetical protein [Armatimonadota bacterium]
LGLGAAVWADSPLAVGVAAVAAVIGSVMALRRTTRNASHAAETVKLSGAHLTLLAGSVLFLIPFAWLISTSLKTDEEQAVFPPVWIPTQQITTP